MYDALITKQTSFCMHTQFSKIMVSEKFNSNQWAAVGVKQAEELKKGGENLGKNRRNPSMKGLQWSFSACTFFTLFWFL